jgi:hypothetical protein
VIGDLAPDAFAISRNKRRSLKEVLWVRDLSLQAMQQFVALWEFAQDVQLDASTPDKIIWKWTANGEYYASSAYRA